MRETRANIAICSAGLLLGVLYAARYGAPVGGRGAEVWGTLGAFRIAFVSVPALVFGVALAAGARGARFILTVGAAIWCAWVGWATAVSSFADALANSLPRDLFNLGLVAPAITSQGPFVYMDLFTIVAFGAMVLGAAVARYVPIAAGSDSRSPLPAGEEAVVPPGEGSEGDAVLACRHCGAPMEEDDNFCEMCGKKRS